MNKEQKKEVKKLPGFYIALCCCVLVIGVAGYFTESNNSDDDVSTVISNEVSEESEEQVFSPELDKYTSASLTEEDTDTSSDSSAETEEVGVIEIPPVDESVPVVSQPQEIEEYAIDNPDVEASAVIVSTEQPAFIMPVSGNILGEYSDNLVYNEALSDWRTHDGIDIAAEKGCSVQSAADGVIDEISEDAMGGCVTVSHAAGFTTKYIGLEDTESLTVGKEIKSGEVLGILGDCKGENVTDSHLHFEITQNGESINPSEYLPQ